MDSKTRGGIIAGILGNSIFGFSFMFSRIAMNVAAPFIMLMYRFVIAFILINITVLISRRFKNCPKWMRCELRGKKLMPLVLLGILQPVVYFLCESYGIDFTNATMSGVMIALIPIAALVLGFVMLHEKPRFLQVVFCLVSIGGVVLMTLQQNSDGNIRLIGVLLLFGAVLFGALFNVFSRHLAQDYTPLECTYVMMGVGAACFAILAVLTNTGNMSALTAPLKSGAFMGSMAYLALLSSILAFLMLNVANGALPVARATAFSNLSTVISLFAGAVFLGEPFTVVSGIAAVLIVTGIIGVQKS